MIVTKSRNTLNGASRRTWTWSLINPPLDALLNPPFDVLEAVEALLQSTRVGPLRVQVGVVSILCKCLHANPFFKNVKETTPCCCLPCSVSLITVTAGGKPETLEEYPTGRQRWGGKHFKSIFQSFDKKALDIGSLVHMFLVFMVLPTLSKELTSGVIRTKTMEVHCASFKEIRARRTDTFGILYLCASRHTCCYSVTTPAHLVGYAAIGRRVCATAGIHT